MKYHGLCLARLYKKESTHLFFKRFVKIGKLLKDIIQEMFLLIIPLKKVVKEPFLLLGNPKTPPRAE